MKTARGGREKVKELNSKEHRDVKSSGFWRNKCEVACTEKGGFSQWLCFCFFTLSTHTSAFFNQGNLLCLALLIFRGKGVGGGNRRLMRLHQMQHSREAVGITYIIFFFKQWLMVFDPHPCCPSSSTSLEPPLSSRAAEERRGLGTGRKSAEFAGRSPQVLLEQPFQPLSEARR